MSEASPAGRPAQQEFEKVLTAATTTVASFEEERLTLLQRIQRFLHAYPTTVPFVVLALGLLLGVAVNPVRFTTASNISTDTTQVMVTGILGIGQTLVILTAGHRSLDRRHHGHFVRCDGPSRRARRRADDPRLPARSHLRLRLRLPQRRARHPAEDAAVHRHARHAQHHRRAQHVLFAERNHRHAGHRGQGAVPAA